MAAVESPRRNSTATSDASASSCAVGPASGAEATLARMRARTARTLSRGIRGDLARIAATADKRYFEGLPSPSGAAILAGFVWMMSDWEVDGLLALTLAFAVALITGGLMVSRFPYVSGKDFDWSRRVPFAVLLLIPLGFVVVGSSPPEMLFGMFGLYGLSGPLAWAWRRLTRARRPATTHDGANPRRVE